MSQAFETIQVQAGGGVMTVTLNRPAAFNAYNAQMGAELGAALKLAARDEAVRCIVLTGAGKAFCSGQDLVEIKEHYAAGNERSTLDFGQHLRSKFNPLVARLRSIEKPVVAAVNGIAAGAGASFAFACDLRIASAEAAFIMAFVHVGLVPDSGATQTLVQHVGLGRATELCMLGEKLGAAEAQRAGLVNRVVEAEELADATAELAAKLAALPTRALGLTKRALNRAWSRTLAEQLEYEAFLQQTAGQTADHVEGVRAFIEKRRPAFRGA